MEKLAKILSIPVRHPVPPQARQAYEPAPHERRARWVLLALLVAALGLFWAGVTLSLREEEAGIRGLSRDARQALYTRTLDEVATLCREDAAAAGSLHDHCVAQARFVLRFPECADACQRDAALVVPHARR